MCFTSRADSGISEGAVLLLLGNWVFPHTHRDKSTAHDRDPLCSPERKVPGVGLMPCG